MNKTMVMAIVGIIFVSCFSATVVSTSVVNNNISDDDENITSCLGTIEVWLFTQEGRCPTPIEDALITLKSDNGLIKKIGITEVGGNKKFDYLPFGNYTIKTMKTGYETGSANITITSEEPYYFVSIGVDETEETTKQKNMPWTQIQSKFLIFWTNWVEKWIYC